MWLMARVIKSMGIKMVLSGEDRWTLEVLVFSTKLQMLKNFTKETVRKLSKLHMYGLYYQQKFSA
jgi:asparagine synthase (glutamine-hydrolysing)